MDDRDRLIIALCAQLKAERETRETFATALRSHSVSFEVLEAMLSDPVPVIAREEMLDLRTATQNRRSELKTG